MLARRLLRPLARQSRQSRHSSSQSNQSSPLSVRLQKSLPGRALQWYADRQARRPYLTQFYSTVVIFLLSDLSAQLFVPYVAPSPEDDEVPYDPVRTVRHVCIGGAVAVPSYLWFTFVHQNFNYASKTLSIAVKVLLSQTIYAPLFNIYFFSAQSLLSGASLPETLQRLAITLPVSIVNSAKVWPAISAFMFLYIPHEFRAVFAGTIALGWQTYLSWLNQAAIRRLEKVVE